MRNYLCSSISEYLLILILKLGTCTKLIMDLVFLNYVHRVPCPLRAHFFKMKPEVLPDRRVLQFERGKNMWIYCLNPEWFGISGWDEMYCIDEYSWRKDIAEFREGPHRRLTTKPCSMKQCP